MRLRSSHRSSAPGCRGGMRGRGAFDEGLHPILRQLIQLVEHPETRAIRGNLEMIEPVATGKGEEIVTGLNCGLPAAEVEAEIADLAFGRGRRRGGHGSCGRGVLAGAGFVAWVGVQAAMASASTARKPPARHRGQDPQCRPAGRLPARHQLSHLVHRRRADAHQDSLPPRPLHRDRRPPTPTGRRRSRRTASTRSSSSRSCSSMPAAQPRITIVNRTSVEDVAMRGRVRRASPARSRQRRGDAASSAAS